MKDIIKTVENLMDGYERKNDAESYIVGEQIMLILYPKTNLHTLKNPIKCFKKIISKIAQKKDTQQVLKYCKLVGLKQI